MSGHCSCGLKICCDNQILNYLLGFSCRGTCAKGEVGSWSMATGWSSSSSSDSSQVEETLSFSLFAGGDCNTWQVIQVWMLYNGCGVK